jgi:hypothetical protein
VVDSLLWPGFHFGDLLFCRAGVHVRAPSHLIDPTVATTSTLYFTFRREPRRTNDLSHGWGSNSQWRTGFGRFYDDVDGHHLNWDGTTYLGPGYTRSPRDVDEDLSADQRRNLLLHRCFVTAPPPHHEWDKFPFNDRVSLRTTSWPLPADAILPDPAPQFSPQDS